MVIYFLSIIYKNVHTYYWKIYLSLIQILICCFTYGPSDLFRRLCRSTFCRACVCCFFYMFLNMRLYHYHIFISICICLMHFYLTVERNNWLSNILALRVPDKDYSRNVSCALILISMFYYNHWADTSTGRLLVPAECIMWPVVSVSALTLDIFFIGIYSS